MENNKDDIQERMKKIRQNSQDEHNQSMNSPFYIHRPSAPTISIDAALELDKAEKQTFDFKEEKQAQVMTQEQREMVEGIQNWSRPNKATQNNSEAIEELQDKGMTLKFDEDPLSFQQNKKEEKEQTPEVIIDKKMDNKPIEREDTYSTAVGHFLSNSDNDIAFTPNSSKEIMGEILAKKDLINEMFEKPQQEQKPKQEQQAGTYYGHKMTTEQQEICQGLKQNLTKGNAMTNIESMRMKYKH